MPSKVTISVLPLVFLLAACAKLDSSGPASASGDASELEVLRPSSGGEMVLVPSGRFTMGDAAGQPDEQPPHEVHVSEFYIDRYPVTQKLYKNVMGINPSKRKGDDKPVERVQWTDAALFCNRCSQLEGLTPCYDPETWQCDFTADGYRLPTEAEWEYACRAGSQSRYFFGDDESKLSLYAWFKPGSRGHTWSVGEKLPNRWGLYDMHGNVWQWCNDYYSETYYAESSAENPTGPATGKQRVLRGGAWNVTAEKCRAAYRFKEFPVYTDACFGSDSYGFRRVRRAGTSSEPSPAVAQAPQIEPDAAQPSSASSSQGGETAIDSSNVDERDDSPVAGAGLFGAASPAEGVEEGTIDPARLTGTIAFISDRTDSLEIWKMRASGENLAQLTNDSYPDADPRFSPNGARILYTSLRGGFPEVWIMNRDGTKPERITEGSQADWSADGKRIVFIRDDQAYVRELASGAERRVSPDGWQRCGVPAWSPDGKQVAVASRHLGEIGIFLLGLDGKEQGRLETEDPCCTPHWSDDGARMVYQTVKGHIHQIDLDSGSEEQVTFGADIQHDARYSPDGSMIVFCRAPNQEGPWQLCITDLESDDLDTVQITHEGSNSRPDWHASEDD